MNTFDRAHIEAMPKHYRANLINALPGFKPAMLVGTADASGMTNLALFNNVFHIGANPALLGMIIRPNPEGTERHTLNNILNTRCWTLNHVTEATTAQAHQTSARYPQEQSEFDATGLSPLWLEGFVAPFVEQSPVRIGLSLAEHQLLSINNTHLVIGRVEYLQCPESIIRDDGSLDLHQTGSIASLGLDSYHAVTRGQRYRYAKAHQPTERID